MKIAVKLRKADSLWMPYVEQLNQIAPTVILYDPQPDETDEEIEILITTHLSQETLDKLPNLKRIFLFKTGMDRLPLKAIAERGIIVRPSHVNADVIAEHAVALSLSLLHRIPEFHADLCEGVWYAGGSNYLWKSICDMRIGVIGFGAIGRCLCKKLSGFTDSIMGFNRSGVYPNGVCGTASVAELIGCCDLIYLCLPKTEDTVGMIDQRLLCGMHDKFLVNVGRAEVCDEKALFEALEQHTLAGFASDVWYHAPKQSDKQAKVMPSDYPFASLRNVVMSPHCATHELHAHERYICDAVEACIRYMKGDDSDCTRL